MWVAWRAAGDALNTMRSPVLAVSSSPLMQTNGRHGDFSSVVCDLDTNGVTLNTFWTCNGYIKPNGSGITEASWIQKFGGVPSPPVITTQPQSQIAAPGTAVTFSVQATGATPLTYQWNKNSVNIPGATNASVTISGVTTNDAGNYAVAVTG